MNTNGPYNPLDKFNLAQSIETALLRAVATRLDTLQSFRGAGVYVIYYAGDFPAYAPLKAVNSGGDSTLPIYVGKAIPQGGRKGGLSADAMAGTPLFSRLSKHATSIASCTNLAVEDFYVRYLVVDDIWIPLGENMLIETLQPLWNRVIDGFGNNDPGIRRVTQYRSPWDVLHPGRPWADKLAQNPVTIADLEQRIQDHFDGRPVSLMDEPGVNSEDVEEGD